MGVENEAGQIAKVVGDHGLGEAALQPLYSQGRGDLPDKPPGIGKAGLDANPAARAGLGAVGWLCQHRIQQAAAMFQRAFGLEQGRDINLVFHPE